MRLSLKNFQSCARISCPKIWTLNFRTKNYCTPFPHLSTATWVAMFVQLVFYCSSLSFQNCLASESSSFTTVPLISSMAMFTDTSNGLIKINREFRIFLSRFLNDSSLFQTVIPIHSEPNLSFHWFALVPIHLHHDWPRPFQRKKQEKQAPSHKNTCRFRWFPCVKTVETAPHSSDYVLFFAISSVYQAMWSYQRAFCPSNWK